MKKTWSDKAHTLCSVYKKDISICQFRTKSSVSLSVEKILCISKWQKHVKWNLTILFFLLSSECLFLQLKNLISILNF